MLPKLSLADLRAEDLAAEMVRRIAAHTPDYRNPRPGDPGRTLIDVFAYMGEALLYRADLTPRRMRLEFLNLLNLKQRPAEPARGLLQLSPKAAGGAAPVFVAEGTRVNGPVPFEVLTPATVQPFAAHVFIKRRLASAERSELAQVIASLSDVYGIDDVEPYATEKLFGPDDPARPEGVEIWGDSIDQTLWIGLFATDPSAGAKLAARAALDAQPCVLNVGVIPRMVLPDSAAPAEGVASLDWSISSPGASPLAEPAYLDLAFDDDRSRGLTTEGTLRLILPRAAMVAAPGNDLGNEVDAGVGARPPRVDDPSLAARLIGWIRLSSADPAARLSLSWIGINAVMVDQRQSFANLLLGTGTGQAGQRLRLPGQQIDAASLSVSVAEPGQDFLPWAVVPDLGSEDRDARACELDAEAGEIMFGDDQTGRALVAGARVRLNLMRAGGGEEGNLAAASLTRIEVPGVVVYQPAAMQGGRAAEALEGAEKRVSAMLNHRNRCVTPDDYRAVTAELGLARVEVLPGFRPYQRRPDCPGVVSVMVLPDQQLHRPANPRADRRLLDQVKAHLDPRRPLGTELYCISPEYRGLGITAAVGLRDGYAREQVVKAVKDRLYDYLWPLLGGGLEGTGWPLGRTVRNLELEVEIARIPGVLTTQGVNLFADQDGAFRLLPVQSGNGQSSNGLQSLTLDPWALPELLAVEVAVGSGPPAGILTLAAGSTGRGIAVPIVPEMC